MMLYQGLRVERFYWELVNMARKIILLSISVLFSTLSVNYKVLVASTIMIVFLRLQIKLAPYKLKLHNKLEFNEISTGTFTMFTILIFEFADKQIQIFNFLVLLACKYTLYDNIKYSVINEYTFYIVLELLNDSK